MKDDVRTGEQRAIAHGVDRHLLLQAIESLSRISYTLQSFRVNEVKADEEQRLLRKIMRMECEAQEKELAIKNRGYLGFFDCNSPEVIAADRIPITLQQADINTLTTDRHNGKIETFDNPNPHYDPNGFYHR